MQLRTAPQALIRLPFMPSSPAPASRAGHQALREEETIRNFLFLIPGTVSDLERGAVLAAAQRMTSSGYVYLAEGGRQQTEDQDDVRHMPLNEEHLPSFGLATVVVVLHRPDLAEKALELYADAQVFLLNPRVMDLPKAMGDGEAVPGPMAALRNSTRATVMTLPEALGYSA